MVFGVLTCCWDVVHHGFLWYISIFPVIYWVDLGYIPVFTGPYHSAISQRCVIPVLRCDMSDDRVWYSMLYTTFPKAGPLWLPWSGCAGTPRVPVARLWLNLYVFDGTARLLARFTPGIVACSSLIGIKVAPRGVAGLTAHAYIAVNAEHGNGCCRLEQLWHEWTITWIHSGWVPVWVCTIVYHPEIPQILTWYNIHPYVIFLVIYPFYIIYTTKRSGIYQRPPAPGGGRLVHNYLYLIIYHQQTRYISAFCPCHPKKIGPSRFLKFEPGTMGKKDAGKDKSPVKPSKGKGRAQAKQSDEALSEMLQDVADELAATGGSPSPSPIDGACNEFSSNCNEFSSNWL